MDIFLSRKINFDINSFIYIFRYDNKLQRNKYSEIRFKLCKHEFMKIYISFDENDFLERSETLLLKFQKGAKRINGLLRDDKYIPILKYSIMKYHESYICNFYSRKNMCISKIFQYRNDLYRNLYYYSTDSPKGIRFQNIHLLRYILYKNLDMLSCDVLFDDLSMVKTLLFNGEYGSFVKNIHRYMKYKHSWKYIETMK